MEKEKIKKSMLCRVKTFRNASVKLYLVKTSVSCMYTAIILVVFLVYKQSRELSVSKSTQQFIKDAASGQS